MKDQLPCVICNVYYPMTVIGTEFFISTGVCLRCYAMGVDLPSEIWCFGKPKMYVPASDACKRLCPDRVVCRRVVQGNVDFGIIGL